MAFSKLLLSIVYVFDDPEDQPDILNHGRTKRFKSKQDATMNFQKISKRMRTSINIQKKAKFRYKN